MKSTGGLDINSDVIDVKNVPFSAYSTVFPDKQVLEYVSSVIGEDAAKSLFWIHSTSSLDVPAVPELFEGIGNTNAMNDVYPINRYLRKVNVLMQKGQYFIIKFESTGERKQIKLKSTPALLRIPANFFDFLFTRVLPKLSLTKKVYHWITKGKNQVISTSEGLARLIFCGFDIVDYTKIDGQTYVIAIKAQEITHTKEPSEGIIIKLGRVGRNKKIIPVYKLRTMHPYSEYLQGYLYEKHGTEDGDKIINDFRVTRWGKFFRTYWIDEIPMLWNWIKGDLKLIGVRPLSMHKFKTYPVDLQEKRVQYKPGMIPPYYAHLPKTPEEFFDAERKYLEAYKNKPLRTDLSYFLKSLYNIIIKGERSQ